jgi:hypothetical protein
VVSDEKEETSSGTSSFSHSLYKLDWVQQFARYTVKMVPLHVYC